MISSFVYLFSILIATTHSFIFCFNLTIGFLEGASVNNNFASCWVIVEPPPRFPLKATALAKDCISIPECSLKRSSSFA